MYVSGTGGTSQFANFTSLCMAMELAAAFAKSMRVRPNDDVHIGAAGLLGNTMRHSGATDAEPTSGLAKVCSKILGMGIVERVEEYPRLNNRLKHYGCSKDAEHFTNDVGEIAEIMSRLRADAAYIILLGLVKLYGIDGLPAQVDESRRISSVVLGMVEDCVDRHGAGGLDGGVVEKIRKLEEMVENKYVMQCWGGSYTAHLMLDTFRVLVRAAGMLGAPDKADGIPALVRECEGFLPDKMKPSKYKLVGKYTDTALYAWLGNAAYAAVVWMDGKFGVAHEILRAARQGGASRVRFDRGVF